LQPISSKKVALTSVAYAVTLILVASLATSKDNQVARAEELTSSTTSAAPALSPAEQTLKDLKGYKERLTGEQLADLLTAVGFKGNAHKLAWAIAMRESRGRPLAHNTNVHTGDNSYGIFQINMLGVLGGERRDKFGITTNNELFDPVTNAEAVYYMSNGGEDFGAWGIGPNAYRSGAGIETLKEFFPDYPGAGLTKQATK
jgi:hypothetical protein